MPHLNTEQVNKLFQNMLYKSNINTRKVDANSDSVFYTLVIFSKSLLLKKINLLQWLNKLKT